MNKTTLSYIAVIILLMTTSALSFNLFFKQRSDHDILDINNFPYTVGEWNGKALEITELEYRILETRNLISREYVNSGNEKLYLFIVWSETNRSVFHPPEVCLLGSGINILSNQSENLTFGNKTFSLNKLYAEKKGNNSLFLYCYKAGDFYTDNYYFQQGYFALNQLIGKRRGGATIRVSMPKGENEEATLLKLKSFMKSIIETLEAIQDQESKDEG